MALDRLDAIVIGATVEGLSAAAWLAREGKHVAVLDRREAPAQSGPAFEALVAHATLAELGLTQHGLRLSTPPVRGAISADRSFVLWPDLASVEASLSEISPRDADAFAGFRAKLARAASNGAAEKSASAQLFAADGLAPLPDHWTLRANSLASVLGEAFDNPLIVGLFAQCAVMVAGLPPSLPGSATALLSPQILTSLGVRTPFSYVAGGRDQLKLALTSVIQMFNTASVNHGVEVQEILIDREAAQGVILTDGTTLKAPIVISALSAGLTRQLLANKTNGFAKGMSALWKPAVVEYECRTVPKLGDIDPATIASGAVIELNPTLDRLRAAFGACVAQTLPAELCIQLRIVPISSTDGQLKSRVLATIPFVPPSTIDGPWIGNLREALVSQCTKAIERWSPGFAVTIERASLLCPKEPQALAGARPGELGSLSQSARSAATVSATTLTKGLILIQPSGLIADGQAGLAAATLTGVVQKKKTAAHA